MSSRFSLLARLGPIALLTALMGASTFAYPALDPLTGPARTSPTLKRSVDHGVAILARAPRPYVDVTFSETLKAFLPDKVGLQQGPVHTEDAPLRPVIIGQQHGWDYGSVLSRAARDHLDWKIGIGGGEIVAFALDEAHFRAAMVRAGLTLRPSDLRSLSSAYPMLSALATPLSGAEAGIDGWSLPKHRSDGLMLYGPYVELAPGAYHVRLHVQLQGEPKACRAAALNPSIAVTSDIGKVLIQPKATAMTVIAKDDPCSITATAAFEVPKGGAKKLETPVYGASPLPMTVDAYVLEPAAAQSR